MRWLIALASLALTISLARADKPSSPSRILLIRHAEKPPEAEMSNHLNPMGKERADAIPRLFEKSADRPDPLPKPDFLFAAKESKNSKRSIETLEPLSKAWKMPLVTEFDATECANLAKHFQEAKYAGKVVLIAWKHGKLPDLARALGATGVPDKWKDEAFDRVWDIEFKSGTGKMTDRSQRLLKGDSE